ncbi:MAG TPA: DUF4325 domain-containing protein [Solirubrobacteraceae bacterium]|nr:DUF4325 domain-containing protein [Solirubrobacteraceae bacterium]
MASVFRMSMFGRAFATRERGAKIREAFLSHSAGEHATIDFADIANISYSFADEFLGVLIVDPLPDGGRRFDLVNVSPSIERVAERAIKRRQGEFVPC